MSNGAVTIELVSSGSGESAGRDSSPESTEVFLNDITNPPNHLKCSPCQISMPETCGSTAVLVSVTDDLVQVFIFFHYPLCIYVAFSLVFICDIILDVYL